MSVMRKKIAERMVASRRTSAHVHSVFEFDYTRVAKVREARKAEFERNGAKLTFMAFIAKAVCEALKAMPVVNASIDGENVVYRKDVNLGIAVALDWGLIVPRREERRREEPARAQSGDRGRREPCAIEAAQAGGSCRAARSRSPTPRVRHAVRHADHQPAAGAILGVGAIGEACRGD